MIESGEVDGDFSNIYFFLPPIIDRSEEMYQYLNNVSISPIDISQEQFEILPETKFYPSKPEVEVFRCI